MDDHEEHPLMGGRLTSGVVRIAGTVRRPAKWRAFDDTQIVQAANILRRMHDASRDFEMLDAPGQVVCHHDPGPNNAVFRDGQPVAFIDFDFAAPGHPLEDLGYMAWAWCISSRPGRGLVNAQARQVRLLADAYGLTTGERSDLPSSILQRLQRNTQFWTRILEDAHTPAAQRAHASEVLDWTSRESAHFNANHASFDSALG